MILYDLLMLGQHLASQEQNNNNAPRLYYTVTADNTIQFRVGSPDNYNSEHRAGYDTYLGQLYADCKDLGILGLNYLKADASNYTFTILPAGYSKLLELAVANQQLANALMTPQKIMALKFGRPESMATIIQNILDKKDPHFNYAGNSRGSNAYITVKEPFHPLARELYSALSDAIHIFLPRDDKGSTVTDSLIDDETFRLVIRPKSIYQRLPVTTDNYPVELKSLLSKLSQYFERLGIQSPECFEIGEDFTLFMHKQGRTLLTRRKPNVFQQETARQIFSDITHDRITFSTTCKYATINDPANNSNRKFLISNLCNIEDPLMECLSKIFTENDIIAGTVAITFTDFNKRSETALKIVSPSKFINLYSALKRAQGDSKHVLMHANSHVLSVPKKQYEIEFENLLLNIKTLETKRTYFAKNGEVIRNFKNTHEIEKLEKLFNILLIEQDDIDIHEKPTLVDAMLFWKKGTDSWDRAIQIIRHHAFNVVKQKALTMEYQDAINFLTGCLELNIFKWQRKFTPKSLFYATDVIGKINKLIEALKTLMDEEDDSLSDSSSDEEDAAEDTTNDTRSVIDETAGIPAPTSEEEIEDPNDLTMRRTYTS